MKHFNSNIREGFNQDLYSPNKEKKNKSSILIKIKERIGTSSKRNNSKNSKRELQGGSVRENLKQIRHLNYAQQNRQDQDQNQGKCKND